MTPVNLVSERFEKLTKKTPSEEYNYRHFAPKILAEDVARTYRTDGVCAGEIAPDFQLPMVGGGSIRLSELRGRPVLLHFGSYS